MGVKPSTEKPKEQPKEPLKPSKPLPTGQDTIDSSERSERSERVIEVTLQEILEHVRPKLTSVFSEDKLLKEIVDMGIDQEEAMKYVEHFKVKEIVAQDDLKNWYFVRLNQA
jgi:hypothetical protein